MEMSVAQVGGNKALELPKQNETFENSLIYIYAKFSQ